MPHTPAAAPADELPAPEPLGVIEEVHGPVVDILCTRLPPLHQALYVRADGDHYPLEVHRHLDESRARAVALHGTSGLRRHLPVFDSGGPLVVPVTPDCLGRLLDLFGNPLDGGRAARRQRHAPDRRGPGPLDEAAGVGEILPTGIKVIDLLCPFVRGGKTGLFGGAGVGKTVLIMEFMHAIVHLHRGCVGLRRGGRAHPRGPRALARHAGRRRDAAHADGLRPDGRIAGRAFSHRPVGADLCRVPARPRGARRAVPDGQRLSLRPGGQRALGAARAHARHRGLPADAALRGGGTAGAHFLHEPRQHHRGRGGLRAGRRHDRPGRRRDPRAPRHHRDPGAQPGRQGHLSGGRPAGFREPPDGPGHARRAPLPRGAGACASTSRATASWRTSSRCWAWRRCRRRTGASCSARACSSAT